MVVEIALVVWALAPMGDPPPPTAAERLAAANRLADRLSGPNAADDYRRAEEAEQALWFLKFDAGHRDQQQQFDEVDENQLALALMDEWRPGHRRVIDTWIEKNRSTLEALTAATAKVRCFFSAGEDASGLADDATVGVSTSLARMAMLEARRQAIDGHWDAAYEWNFRVHRMADHAYQQAAPLSSFSAVHIERMACRQLLALVRQHPPADLAKLPERLREGDETRCPGPVGGAWERLWLRDNLERFHAWAANPEEYAGVTETVKMMTGESPLLQDMGGIFGKPEYPTVEAFRAAVAALTTEQEWERIERLLDLYASWDALPFHRAWEEVGPFEERYCGVMGTIPSLALFGCTAVPPSRHRLVLETAAEHRRAVDAVVAILRFQQRHGRLPGRLDEIGEGLSAPAVLDCFTGQPLRYHVTEGGRGFLLYGVGCDRKDSGGEPSEELTAPGDLVYWPPVVPTLKIE